MAHSMYTRCGNRTSSLSLGPPKESPNGRISDKGSRRPWVALHTASRSRNIRAQRPARAEGHAGRWRGWTNMVACEILTTHTTNYAAGRPRSTGDAESLSAGGY